jgi:hypothetical protein
LSLSALISSSTAGQLTIRFFTFARAGRQAQLYLSFLLAMVSLKSVVCQVFVSAAVMLHLTLSCFPCLQYPRITLNKITLAFFLFSVIHCFVQGTLHSLLYSIDMDNSNLVKSIIREAKVPRREIARLAGNLMEFELQLCTSIPIGMTDNFCATIFDSRQGNAAIAVPAGFKRSVCCRTSLGLAHCLFVKTG